MNKLGIAKIFNILFLNILFFVLFFLNTNIQNTINIKPIKFNSTTSSIDRAIIKPKSNSESQLIDFLYNNEKFTIKRLDNSQLISAIKRNLNYSTPFYYKKFNYLSNRTQNYKNFSITLLNRNSIASILENTIYTRAP